jgi:hypothetical protein
MEESLLRINQEEEQQLVQKRCSTEHAGLPRWLIVAIVGSAVLSLLSLTLLIATLVVVKMNPAVKYFEAHQVSLVQVPCTRQGLRPVWLAPFSTLECVRKLEPRHAVPVLRY